MLELLRERWKEAPDQRLGQLILNFMRRSDREHWQATMDVFNVEDDLLERSLSKGWPR